MCGYCMYIPAHYFYFSYKEETIMTITKTVLTTAVLAAISGSVFAANTNQVLGNLNKTDFLSNSNVVGNYNEVEGENNNVVGDRNDVSGYSAIAIGNHIDSKGHLYSDINKSYSLSPKGKGNIAIGDHTKAEVAATTAIGYLAQSWGDASVAVGAYSMAFDDVHKVDEKYAGVKTTQGVFSIGNSNYFTTYDRGTTPEAKFKIFTRQLQNVGAGAISATSTDAVNGSQLYYAMEEAKKHATVVAGDNVEVTTDTNANGGNEYTVSVNKDLTDMTSATFGSGDTRNAIDKGGVRVFDGSVNTGVTANGMVIENTDTLEQASYTGSGMQASDDNGTVRFTTSNIDAGNQIVHGIKAGVADTDAVNVKQLKDYMSSNDKDTVTTVKAGNRIKVTNTGHDYTVALDDKTIDQINTTETGMKGNARDIAKLKVDVVEAKTSVSVSDGLNVKPSFNANGSTNYHVTLDSKVTDQIKDNKDAIKANSDKIADNKARIDDLANKVGTTNSNIGRTISENQKEARRGIAGASALAALNPLDYDPEHKVDVMAGVGHFKGTTAVAIGAAYRPNENLMFTVGASINGSTSTLNAGVSYKVGTDAKDTYHSKASMMNKIKQLETTVEEQNAQIEKLMKIVDTLVPANH